MRSPYINPSMGNTPININPGMLGGRNPMGGQQNGQNPAQSGYSWNGNNMGQTGYGYHTYPVGQQGQYGPMDQQYGGLGSALGGIFGGLFGGGQNPADAGMGYLNQIPGQLQKYLNPYIGAGQNAMGTLQGQYGQLVNDPGALMSKLAGGFQSSPGYDFQKQQMTNAVANQAAAGGKLGSPEAQQNMASTVGGLANQDYYNYLNHVLGMYGQGLSGFQDINHMGMDASSQMAQQLAQMSRDQAGMAYSGQANQNQAQGGMAGGIGSLIGGLVGNAARFIPGIGGLFG